MNEVLVLADAAGGDTREHSLNKVLAKSVLVKRAAGGSCGAPPENDDFILDQWTWSDGTPLRHDGQRRAPPPDLFSGFELPPNCLPFYAVPSLKQRWARCFATDPSSPGYIFHGVYEDLNAALKWTGPPHPSLTTSDGEYHFILPSFFIMLQALRARHRDFLVVFRTFGSDLPDVMAAVNAFCRGEHPDFPAGLPGLAMSPRHLHKGRYQGEDYVLECSSGKASSLPAVIDSLSASDAGFAAVQDDYEHWKRHRHAPEAGKPLWLTVDDHGVNHVFFDDNILNDAAGSIVAVRARKSPGTPFRRLDGEAIRRMHGFVLVRVPTPFAILDRRWFLDQIDACERNIARARAVATAHKRAGDEHDWVTAVLQRACCHANVIVPRAGQPRKESAAQPQQMACGG